MRITSFFASPMLSIATLASALALPVALGACASGSLPGIGGKGSGGDDGGGNNTGNAGNTGGVSNGGSGNTGNTGGSGNTGNDGGSGGSGGCPNGQHLCGGVCVGNTPQTGCWASTTCSPCPNAPTSGTVICTADGQCDFNCQAPYMKEGNACACPNECCTNADCTGGATCSNGACVAAPCDEITCVQTCLQQFMLGMCNGNVCECVPFM
jgi:hypothetical protein